MAHYRRDASTTNHAGRAADVESAGATGWIVPTSPFACWSAATAVPGNADRGCESSHVDPPQPIDRNFGEVPDLPDRAAAYRPGSGCWNVLDRTRDHLPTGPPSRPGHPVHGRRNARGPTLPKWKVTDPASPEVSGDHRARPD